MHRDCLTNVLPILLKNNGKTRKILSTCGLCFILNAGPPHATAAVWRFNVKKTNLWSLIAVVGLFVPTQGVTAPDVIGTASARGSMRVDGAPVVSNATLSTEA